MTRTAIRTRNLQRSCRAFRFFPGRAARALLYRLFFSQRTPVPLAPPATSSRSDAAQAHRPDAHHAGDRRGLRQGLRRKRGDGLPARHAGLTASSRPAACRPAPAGCAGWSRDGPGGPHWAQPRRLSPLRHVVEIYSEWCGPSDAANTTIAQCYNGLQGRKIKFYRVRARRPVPRDRAGDQARRPPVVASGLHGQHRRARQVQGLSLIHI